MKKQRQSTKISEHFARRDFTCKCSDCDGQFRISLGLIGALELLRSKAKGRIDIQKGFVCLDCAEKEGTTKKNYHTQGIAADITCQNVSIKDLFLVAETIEEFKGIGLNLSANTLHVDTRKDANRTMWIKDKDNQVSELSSENKDECLAKLP